MSPFEDKVFAITGAASGIGRALASVLVQQGGLVSLADVNEDALREVKIELQQQSKSSSSSPSPSPSSDPKASSLVFTKVVDVRSQAACTDWITATVEHFKKPLHGAANLAGVFGPSITQDKGSIRNITDEEFDWVMDVNVKGTLNCLRAQLPHMQVGSQGRNGGSIVNAASVAGISGVPLDAPYVAAKHAIVGLTRTAAKEEGERAIRVNAVAPTPDLTPWRALCARYQKNSGIIETPMIKAIEAAKGSDQLFGPVQPGALARKGDAKEVAEAIAYLLGPQSSFVNGVVLPIEGGWFC